MDQIYTWSKTKHYTIYNYGIEKKTNKNNYGRIQTRILNKQKETKMRKRIQWGKLPRWIGHDLWTSITSGWIKRWLYLARLVFHGRTRSSAFPYVELQSNHEWKSKEICASFWFLLIFMNRCYCLLVSL